MATTSSSNGSSTWVTLKTAGFRRQESTIYDIRYHSNILRGLTNLSESFVIHVWCPSKMTPWQQCMKMWQWTTRCSAWLVHTPAAFPWPLVGHFTVLSRTFYTVLLSNYSNNQRLTINKEPARCCRHIVSNTNCTI